MMDRTKWNQRTPTSWIAVTALLVFACFWVACGGGAGSANSTGWDAITTPKLTGISPTSGPTTGGTTVAITGTDFQQGATVVFGDVPAAKINSVTSTSIQAVTPVHDPGKVDVKVTNPDTRSDTLLAAFTFEGSPPPIGGPPPTISSVLPNSGPVVGGTVVTITGTNFQSGATVTFGLTPAAAVVFSSATQLLATTPAHAQGTVDVIVRNPDTQPATVSGGFTYQPVPAPTIIGILPTSGPEAGGTLVTITGTNFLPGAAVSFGGVDATGVTVVSSTQIGAVTPAQQSAGPVAVVVTNPDGHPATLPGGFTYTGPPPPPPPGAFFISPSGNDNDDGKSASTPFKTFSKAFSAMAAGDTLVLLDGTYSEAAGTGILNCSLGAPSGCPVSGTSTSAMTTIMAQQDGLAKHQGQMRLGKSGAQMAYVKFQGILVEGDTWLYYTHHIYMKYCGFHDPVDRNGNVFKVGDGPNGVGGIGTDNYSDLIEDCWIWGKPRIMADSFLAGKIVWRRVVIRHDGYTVDTGPQVCITAYTSTNISMQNVLCVDSLVGTGTSNGDFAVAQHTPGAPFGNIEWLGDISLNTEFQPWSADPESGTISSPYTHKLENCIVADPATRGGMNFQRWGVVQAANLTIKTKAAKTTSYDAFRIASDLGGNGSSVKNILVFGTARYGINSSAQPSYANVCNAGTCDWSALYNQTTCQTGCYTGDPQNDGTPASMKYITRIEAGSALKGAGDGGADIGANVVNRYGTDGAFWGDANYNTLSGTALWPWPSEARIMKEMCTDSGETRGFCSKSSLTEYVWTYLGNPVPATF